MSGLAGKLLALGDFVLAEIFHPICLHCESYCGAASLCQNCLVWEPTLGNGCAKCGAGVPQPVLECGSCVRRKPPWVAARSLLRLSEPMRSVLHQIKYGKWPELLELFSSPLEEYFLPFFPAPLSLVPVPLHRGRAAERGFNQAEVLARQLSRQLGFPVVRGLRKLEATEPQSVLSERERRKNLRGVFSWAGAAPERALLVDDVFTTGSTMTEAAKVLLRSGVREVYVWTLFRA